MDWWWVILVALRGVSTAPEDEWAVRLADLDRVRATAFEHADPVRLDDVYVADSDAQRSDARAISAYAARGGRLVGAELTILQCRVVRSSRDRAVLEIVDRLGPTRVVWDDGTSTTLPRDLPSMRIVTIQRTAAGWRVAGSRQG